MGEVYTTLYMLPTHYPGYTTLPPPYPALPYIPTSGSGCEETRPWAQRRRKSWVWGAESPSSLLRC